MTNSAPAYKVVVSSPIYDNRDAIVGSRRRVVAAACTRRWAAVLLGRYLQNELGGEDFYLGEGSIYIDGPLPARDFEAEVFDADIPF